MKRFQLPGRFHWSKIARCLGTRHAPALLCVAAFMSSFAGCQQDNPTSKTEAANKTTVPDAAPAPPKEVTVRIVTPDEYATFLKSQHGKVVLVDVWATWCGPCREAFPHTVALAKTFSQKDVTIVTLSQDVTTQQDEVLKFLKAQDARIENLMCRYTPEQSDNDYDILKDYGIVTNGIPFYAVYGRDGKPFRTFIGGAQEKEIEAAIREAVAKK